MRLTTNLKLLRKNFACKPGYAKLRKYLGPKYPNTRAIDLLTILESNGIEDAIWALRATVEDSSRIARLMAADFAKQALPIWEKYFPDDDRPAKAIQAARDFASGLITVNQLDAARDAAWAAAGAAAGAAARDAAWAAAGAAAGAAARDAAWDAARAAAWAAAWDAAGAAARDAAWDAARDAAGAAAGAAAGDAARDAAWDAARAKQRDIFIDYLKSKEVHS